MASESQQLNVRDNTPSTLNLTIDALNLANDNSNIAPVQAAFSAVAGLLAVIRVFRLLLCGDRLPIHILQDFVVNEEDYTELGLYCAEICTVLGRGVNGKSLDDLDRSVREAINQLTTWVEPEMYDLDGLPMIHFVTELSRGSSRRQPNRMGAAASPGFFTLWMIRTRLPLGSQNSIGFFASSMYVQFVLLSRY